MVSRRGPRRAGERPWWCWDGAVSLVAVAIAAAGLSVTGGAASAQSVDEPWKAAVTGLTVTAGVAAGEIDVAWDAHPEGADDYRVAWAPDGESFRSASDSDWNAFPTTNQVTLGGLEPGDAYNVKVRARSGRRRSEWSSVVTADAADAPQTQQQSSVGGEPEGADDTRRSIAGGARDERADATAVPVITSAGSFAVAEGSTSVATLAASDADTAVGDLVWSKAGGADAAAFALSGAGELAFGSAKDFEQPDDTGADGTYELTVQVSDSDNDVTADLLVTVENVIELEAIEGPETVDFAENSWSRVATFTASSPQDRDGIVWTLGGDDAARFSIDRPSGALRFDLDAVAPVIFSKPPDFEAPVGSGADNIYEVTLLPGVGATVADAPVSVTVTVSDVDEVGTVSLSTKRPRKGVEVTATLADPDGVVDGSAAWTWGAHSRQQRLGGDRGGGLVGLHAGGGRCGELPAGRCDLQRPSRQRRASPGDSARGGGRGPAERPCRSAPTTPSPPPTRGGGCGQRSMRRPCTTPWAATTPTR